MVCEKIRRNIVKVLGVLFLIILIFPLSSCINLIGSDNQNPIVNDNENVLVTNTNEFYDNTIEQNSPIMETSTVVNEIDNSTTANETSLEWQLKKIKIENDYFAILEYINWYTNDELYSIIPDKRGKFINYLHLNLLNDEIKIIPIYAPGVPVEDQNSILGYFGDTVEQIYIAPEKNQYVIFVNTPQMENQIWPWHNYEIWKFNKQTSQFTVLIDKNSDFQLHNRIVIEITPSSVAFLENENQILFFADRFYFQNLIDLESGDYHNIECNLTCNINYGPIFSRNGEKVIVDDGIYWSKDYFDYIEQFNLLGAKIDEDSEAKKNLYEKFNNKKIITLPENLIAENRIIGINFSGDYYYFQDIDSGKSDNRNIGNLVKVNIQTGDMEIIIPDDIFIKNGLDVADLKIILSPDDNRVLLIPDIWGDVIYVYTINK